MNFLIEISIEGMSKLMNVSTELEMQKANNLLSKNRLIVSYPTEQEFNAFLNRYNDKLKSPPAEKKIVRSLTKRRSIEFPLWNYDKISHKKWNVIYQAIKKDDYMTIFELHNEGKWTDLNYCCDSYKPHVRKNILEASMQGVKVPDEVLKIIMNEL